MWVAYPTVIPTPFPTLETESATRSPSRPCLQLGHEHVTHLGHGTWVEGCKAFWEGDLSDQKTEVETDLDIVVESGDARSYGSHPVTVRAEQREGRRGPVQHCGVAAPTLAPST